MSVVADSSPLILFAKIGRLDLLRTMYREVLIPPAVRREVVEEGSSKPGSSEIAAAHWIVASIVALAPSPPTATHLGAGEAEAVALAKSRGLTILMDDPAGRAAARAEGVAVTGSAGVLLAAKRRGVLSVVQPTLDALVAAGLRLDGSLYRQLLGMAGESHAE